MKRHIASARPARGAPLLGALSVALVVVAIAVAGDPTNHHALGPEIRDAYDNETRHQIAAFLTATAAVPLLFFAAYWRAVLQRSRPSDRFAAHAVVAGAVVAASGLAAAAVIHGALAEAAQTREFSDAGLQALNVIDGWSFYPVAVGLSAFVLASGLAWVHREPAFASLLGRVGVALGALGLIPILGLFAAALSGAWLIVLSVNLFIEAEAVGGMHDEPPSRVDATREVEARV